MTNKNPLLEMCLPIYNDKRLALPFILQDIFATCSAPAHHIYPP